MTTRLKFLLDVGVGKKVERWLIENGYDVKSMRYINPKANDSEILHLAVAECRMVITMDKDFGELVYNSGELHSGVLILRLEDANGDQKVEIVKKIFSEYLDKIQDKFCVFQGGRLSPKIDFDFWGNLQVGCQTRQRPFLRRAVYHQYGEEQKCADNEVWQANRRFVK